MYLKSSIFILSFIMLSSFKIFSFEYLNYYTFLFLSDKLNKINIETIIK